MAGHTTSWGYLSQVISLIECRSHSDDQPRVGGAYAIAVRDFGHPFQKRIVALRSVEANSRQLLAYRSPKAAASVQPALGCMVMGDGRRLWFFARAKGPSLDFDMRPPAVTGLPALWTWHATGETRRHIFGGCTSRDVQNKHVGEGASGWQH